tara:strand:+ start:8757 stop:8936 length:180 start_codon:yes stop_codon:yes gene_type:complete
LAEAVARFGCIKGGLTFIQLLLEFPRGNQHQGEIIPAFRKATLISGMSGKLGAHGAGHG